MANNFFLLMKFSDVGLKKRSSFLNGVRSGNHKETASQFSAADTAVSFKCEFYT
jgi:hypothetical protein